MVMRVEKAGNVAQWQQLVAEAENQAGQDLGEDMQSYLVFTLMNYLCRPEMANRVLALEYLQAGHAQGREQQLQYRQVGDECLLFSGLFPKRAERRRVRISYYVDLGRSAYQQLGESRNPLARLYSQMAEAFVSAMDVLQIIGQMRDQSTLDPLNATELWLDTGSRQALRALQEVTQAIPVSSISDAGTDDRLH